MQQSFPNTSRHPTTYGIQNQKNRKEDYVNFVTTYVLPNAISLPDINYETQRDPIYPMRFT